MAQAMTMVETCRSEDGEEGGLGSPRSQEDDQDPYLCSISYRHPADRRIEKVNESKLESFLQTTYINDHKVAPNYYQASLSAGSRAKRHFVSKRLPGSPEPFAFYVDPNLESSFEESSRLGSFETGSSDKASSRQSMPFWTNICSAITFVSKEQLVAHASRTSSKPILVRALELAQQKNIGKTVGDLAHWISNSASGFVKIDSVAAIEKGDLLIGYDDTDLAKDAAICFDGDRVLNELEGRPSRLSIEEFCASPRHAKVVAFRFAQEAEIRPALLQCV